MQRIQWFGFLHVQEIPRSLQQASVESGVLTSAGDLTARLQHQIPSRLPRSFWDLDAAGPEAEGWEPRRIDVDVL